MRVALLIRPLQSAWRPWQNCDSYKFLSIIIDIMIYIMDYALKKRGAVPQRQHGRASAVRIRHYVMGGAEHE
jgi:hypothetical protein